MNDAAAQAAEPGVTTARGRRRTQDITARDREALRWLGEQYGARLDVLGVLLGRLGEAGEPLSHWTVRSHVDRWERAGLVRKERALGQMWVTPTRRGLDRVELTFPVWAMPVTRIRHCHCVNVVRLWYEAQSQSAQVPWTSERMLYAERRNEQTWHVPDGAWLEVDPETERPVRSIAIEVELSHKTRKAYDEDVFSKLRHGTTGLMFYVPDRAFADRLSADIDFVRQSRPTLPQTVVRLLPEVPGATYDGAW